jgi:hypothetical protein
MAATPIIERIRRNLGDMNGAYFTPAAIIELLDEAGGDEYEATRIGLWRKVTVLSNFNQKASGYDADQAQRNHESALRQYNAWVEYMNNRSTSGGVSVMTTRPIDYAQPTVHTEYGG